MTVRDDLYANLVGDTALNALLVGGVHTNSLIDRQLTPGAFDANNEIRPCSLLRVETEVPVGGGGAAIGGGSVGGFTSSYMGRDAARLYVLVYFYQRRGYDVIRQARARVFALWHEARIGAATWQIFWADDVSDQIDEALGCSLDMSRYMVVHARQP